jgi:hypothetical protein
MNPFFLNLVLNLVLKIGRDWYSWIIEDISGAIDKISGVIDTT